MTKRKSNKQLITEAVLKELPKSYKNYHELPIEEVMFKWWFTGRQEGLRLNDEGMAAFAIAEIEFYDYSFSQDGKSYYSFISDLNKKMKCPYYLGANKKGIKDKFMYIRVYDSKIAMIMALFGNLQEYLNSIEVKR
jgi:hypothetical protein